MRKIILCGIILLQVFLVNLHGQFHFNVGPQTGLNFNIHTGRGLVKVENGFGSVFGFQFDMDFNDTLGMVIDLQFYDNRSGSLIMESSYQYHTDQGVINSAVRVENSRRLAYFLIEPMFKLTVPHSRLYVVLGAGIGININGSIEDNITTTLPDGYIFQETGTNQLNQDTKTALSNLLTRFEIKVGSGYDIPVSKRLFITPQINLGYGITPVQNDVQWWILTVQSQVAVKFALIR